MVKGRRGKIVKSLSILFNRTERKQRTLIQWRQTIKSIYKGGNKANISESQRGIFLVNIISKVYELVKIIQNDKNNRKMSEMQAAGRKERSAIDNLIIMSTKTQHIHFLCRCY